MKQTLFWKMTAVSLVCAVIVTACKGPNDPVKPTNPTTQDGYGTVSISFGGGSARTLLPSEIDITKLHYVLTFTQQGGSGNITETQNGSGQLTLQLTVGTWNLVIRGYNSSSDAIDTSKALVSYTQNGIVVQFGGSVTINAKLLPNLDNLTQTGSGTLRYAITLPAGTAGALKVYTHPANTLVGSPVVLSTTENRGSLELASGYYNISVNMEYQGKVKTWSEIAHINDNAITEMVVGPNDFTDSLPPPGPVDIYLSMDKFSMTDEGAGVFADLPPIVLKKGTDSETIAASGLIVIEWRVGDAVLGTGNSITLNAASFPIGVYTLNLTFIKNGKPWQSNIAFSVGMTLDNSFVFNSIADFSTWLATQPVNTAGTAYNVILQDINLDASNGWADLKTALGTAKYVALDLTDCTGTTMPNSAFNNGGWNGSSWNDSINLTGIKTPSTLISIGDSAFYDNMGSCLSSVTLNEGLKTIGSYAFGHNGSPNISITSIEIPSTVTSIGYGAFESSYSLTSVSLPATASLDTRVFAYCSSVRFTVRGTGSLSTALDGVLLIKDGNTVLAGSGATGNITLPNSITSIANHAFSSSRITSIDIPSTLTTIESNAFYMCWNLTSITLPATISSFGSGVFTYCPALYTVVGTGSLSTALNGMILIQNGNKVLAGNGASGNIILPDLITTIGFWAFSNAKVSSIDIPSTVTSIEAGAFYQNPLNNIVLRAVTPPSFNDINYFPSATIIYVPAASLSAYQTATGWSAFSSRITAY